MLRTPPHILVTTPESLYLLLTSSRSRAHAAHRPHRDRRRDPRRDRRPPRRAPGAVARAARGRSPNARCSGSACRRRRSRSTTSPASCRQRRRTSPMPIGDACAIVDRGTSPRRSISRSRCPRSPLDAVMAHEVWEEYYDRLAALIARHKTTLVFVNTRKLAERVARSLSERLGEERSPPTTAACRRRRGSTRNSGSRTGGSGRWSRPPRSSSASTSATSTWSARSARRTASRRCCSASAGRVTASPARPRDGCCRCRATIWSSARRCSARSAAASSTRIVTHDAPLDVLAQQLVAEVACERMQRGRAVRAGAPGVALSRAVARADFDAVVTMVAEGFATRRGRRGALVHRDEVHGTLRGRRGARLLALTSGGAIPEVADYRVVLEPEETFVGTLNEDFAIESNAGDIFQLGNTSWQHPAGRRRARCASPTRTARRRRSRSGSARRRRAATSCRAPFRTCAATSTAA